MPEKAFYHFLFPKTTLPRVCRSIKELTGPSSFPIRSIRASPIIPTESREFINNDLSGKKNGSSYSYYRSPNSYLIARNILSSQFKGTGATLETVSKSSSIVCIFAAVACMKERLLTDYRYGNLLGIISKAIMNTYLLQTLLGTISGLPW